MTRPSPQLLFSAIVSTLAMGAFALSGPAISASGETPGAASPVVAGTEMVSPPAWPSIFPR
ncbi:hypothetical protein [Tsuneonella sp. SYSU-LHT278]|uniref:hypothetical protein n=1 Tax=Tsuneonella sediminis TaxID=3416089 RepID=UPI003F78D9F3